MGKSKGKVVPIHSLDTMTGTSDSGWLSDKKTKWGNYKRCYDSHPALELKLPEGGTKFVYGGSCSYPVHTDADIYVGLDYSMANHKQRFPWEAGHAIHFEIKDMSVPKNPEEFRELIDWLADEIRKGSKVHIGCIGGHGRTGIVLSALVSVLTDEEDPITYVRKKYCKKAVESAEQVRFLVKYFHCKTVKGAKENNKIKTVSKTSKALQGMINPVSAKHCIFGELDVK